MEWGCWRSGIPLTPSLPMRVNDTAPKSIEGTALGLVSLIGIGVAAIAQPVAGRANDLSRLPNRRSLYIVAGTVLCLPWLVLFGLGPNVCTALVCLCFDPGCRKRCTSGIPGADSGSGTRGGARISVRRKECANGR